MLVIFASIGLILVALSNILRNRRTGESLNKWGEFWPSKDSLTPIEYWLHRGGFIIAGVGIVVSIISFFALLVIYQR